MDQKKLVLIASTIASFLTPFMGSAVNLALPSIEKEFELDAIFLAWITTAFLLSTAMFLVPMGRLGDIKGRKSLFVLGLLIFTLSSLLCSLAISGESLVVFRFLQGIGSAMIASTGVAMLTSAYPPQERGKVIGINTSAVYVGLSSGPILGGLITQHLGWRALFLFPLFIAFFAIFAILKVKQEWAEAKGEKFDLTGSLMYTISLFMLIYGFSHLPETLGFLLVFGGILALILFALIEGRTSEPVLNVKMFRKNTVFAMSNLAALLNYSATFAVAFLMSLYLQYIKELSPQEAGLILLAQPVMMALFSPIAGALSDRIEPRIVASIGMALTALSLFLFSIISYETPMEYIIGNLILIGFGFGLFSSPNTNAVMSSVERKFYGLASATLATMRVIGQAFSMGLVTLIFALLIGKSRIPEVLPDFIIALKTAFVVSAVLCIFGVFASLARGKVRN
ncbi:MAG: MFS transporter [Archaeoglobales archaeon]|nr:MFS transporter [Archaeoglobales archaeon]